MGYVGSYVGKKAGGAVGGAIGRKVGGAIGRKVAGEHGHHVGKAVGEKIGKLEGRRRVQQRVNTCHSVKGARSTKQGWLFYIRVNWWYPPSIRRRWART